MKLIINTKKSNKGLSIEKAYFVKLPNYFNTDRIDEVLKEVTRNFSNFEEVTGHVLMGDSAMTLSERKQLDIHGRIIAAPIELECPILY